jgi:hypothetical protein
MHRAKDVEQKIRVCSGDVCTVHSVRCQTADIRQRHHAGLLICEIRTVAARANSAPGGPTDSNSQSTPNRDRRKAPLTPDVSAETSSLRDQAIAAERRKLMQVHSLLHCLSEVLLHADGEEGRSAEAHPQQASGRGRDDRRLIMSRLASPEFWSKGESVAASIIMDEA